MTNSEARKRAQERAAQQPHTHDDTDREELENLRAEVGGLRQSRAELADENERLRNHLAGLDDLRGLKRAYDTACEQTEREMDRRIAAERENKVLRERLAKVEKA